MSLHKPFQTPKERLRAAFLMYDVNSDGLSTKEFALAMRGYGLNPSQSEISNYVKGIPRDPRGNISFEDFSNFMLDKMSAFDSPEDIVDAFRTFDMEQKGFISVDELRHVLMNLGEKFSEQEMNEFLKTARANAGGDVDYREFVNRMVEVSKK